MAPIFSLPESVVSELCLRRLPTRYLGCTIMSCVKLRAYAGDVVLQITRSMHLRKRQGESIGSLLYAIRVMRPAVPESAIPPSSDGRLTAFAWGNRDFGQLGYKGCDWELGVPRQVDAMCEKGVRDVYAGGHNSAFVNKDSQGFICGRARFGQLGLGRSASSRPPANVATPQLLEALSHLEIVEIALGWSHTALLTSKGKVYTCGHGRMGQLGHGGSDNEYSPREVEFVVDGVVQIIKQISAATYHTAALTNEGEVFTFGCGDEGKLGLGDLEDVHVPRRVDALIDKYIVQVLASERYTAVLTDEGEVYTLGSLMMIDKEGALMNSSRRFRPYRIGKRLGERVVQMASGYQHMVLLTSKGKVYTYGCGDYGQLGHDSHHFEAHPREVASLSGNHIVQVAAGASQTAVLNCRGDLFTFGNGEHGQLGHRNDASYCMPRKVEPPRDWKGAVKVVVGGDFMAVLAYSRWW